MGTVSVLQSEKSYENEWWGDGCTLMLMYLIPLNYALKNG